MIKIIKEIGKWLVSLLAAIGLLSLIAVGITVYIDHFDNEQLKEMEERKSKWEEPIPTEDDLFEYFFFFNGELLYMDDTSYTIL